MADLTANAGLREAALKAAAWPFDEAKKLLPRVGQAIPAKGCVLFESLLKANPKNAPTQQTLGQVLRHLATDLGLTSAPSIGNTDFPTVVSLVAGANYDIATAIEFTGRVRNTVGHNLGWNATFYRSHYDGKFQDRCRIDCSREIL